MKERSTLPVVHLDEGVRSRSLARVTERLQVDHVIEEAWSQPAQLFVEIATGKELPPESMDNVRRLRALVREKPPTVRLTPVGDDQVAHTVVSLLLRSSHVYVLTADARSDATSLIGYLQLCASTLNRDGSLSGITVLLKPGRMTHATFAEHVDHFIRNDTPLNRFRLQSLG